MIAEQIKKILMQCRRASVCPEQLERRILFAEVPLPEHASVKIEADQLSGTEPCIDPLSVGDTARAREIVVGMYGRQRSFSRKTLFPYQLAIAPAKALNDERDRFIISSGVGLLLDQTPADLRGEKD